MQKVAVINGGCSAIGRAIAIQFAKDGFLVVPIGRNEKKLQDIYGSNNYCVADVLESDYKAIASDIFQRYGKIDIFVNSLGVVSVGNAFELLDSDWQLDIDTNVIGTIKAATAFAKVMTEIQSGVIILIGGMLALQPESVLISGGVCAAAINNFAKGLSKTLSGSGVRINVINPGATDTPLFNNIKAVLAKKMSVSSDVVLEHTLENNPLGRLALPQDIANTVSFLASEEASYLNGAFISLDGSTSGAY